MHAKGDADGDGSFETTADNVVFVSCGCSDTPTSTITLPPMNGSSASPCLEGGSFSVESETLPDAEGCFVDTTELRHELPVYTTSGTLDIGQVWMVAIESIDDGISEVSVMQECTSEAW